VVDDGVRERSRPVSTRRNDFEEFVAVCSDRLLRTAYLLTRDATLAEELLDRALTKAWFGWGHLEEQPEPYVRRVLVNDYATWWRRRWGEGSRRQRAVVVLRSYDDLSVEDVADLLDCSETTVRRLERRGPDEGDQLEVEADRLDPPLTPQERASRVAQRVQSSGSRRRGSLGAAVAVASVAAVAALVVVPPLLPDQAPPRPAPDDPMVDTPPKLAGFPMPQKVRVRDVTYAYVRGQEAPQSRGVLRIAVAPTRDRQVFGWATSAGTTGGFTVSVDGRMVDRGTGGTFEYGVALTPEVTHLLVVQVLRPDDHLKMALAIWGPDRF
jgi:DNA-directed RNA polymerase specialized sigma24 family protein